MISKLIAAVAVAAVLPAAAQTTSVPQGEPREAQVQVLENKAVAGGKVTPRERASVAKSQAKPTKKTAKKKPNPAKAVS
jgi:hypothetical protein